MSGVIGPLMISIGGLVLTPEEREMFANPLLGGLILFSRNYRSVAQLSALCASAREAASGRTILIAVDHEGGRVQRFRAPFTPIPPMRAFGQYYERDPQQALALAHNSGRLIAAELGSIGIDFSFTPVVDIDYGVSEVIGDRAWHRDPAVVVALAGSLVAGLRENGMAAVGKHFPGHGAVRADSHTHLPVDEREAAAVFATDVRPFAALVAADIAGIMPAHVVYARMDHLPAGFSHYWLQVVLREQLGFAGAIFSDDLTMQAAGVGGNIMARARMAAEAGCDMLLVCNDRPAIRQLLSAGHEDMAGPHRQRRLAAMSGAAQQVGVNSPCWHRIREQLTELEQ